MPKKSDDPFDSIGWKDLKDLSVFEKKEEEGAVEINNAHVWHEIGHVVGGCLIKILGYKPNQIREVIFNDAPKVLFKDPFFFIEGKHNETEDCFNKKNLLYDKEKLETKLENKIKRHRNRAKAELISLISGGLFHIYPFDSNPSEEMLDLCFENNPTKNITDNYRGCAGKDWDKCRRILCYLDINDLNRLKTFRRSLFNLYVEKKIFESFSGIINDLDPFGSISGKELDLLWKKSLKIVSNIDIKGDLEDLILKLP